MRRTTEETPAGPTTARTTPRTRRDRRTCPAHEHKGKRTMSLRTPTTRTRVGALGAAVVLALSLTACGDDSSSGDSTDVTVEDNPDFPADSTMAKLSDDGKITIGVKIDQPGIGNLEPGADAPEGFDIE